MTGTQILNSALALMAESTATATTYSAQALLLINLMMPELFNLNNSMLVARGETPLTSIPQITELSDTVNMDDRITIEILPFGLAAKLVLDDDLSKAAYFNNEFIEKKNTLAVTSIETITDVYSEDDE